VTTTDLIHIDPDGRAVVGNVVVEVPNLAISRIIGTGANGVVFLAAHRYLARDLAVKIWLTLRHGDRRDKFAQGIAEARKAASVDESRRILRIYDAGAMGQFFYATMDYFPGITIRQWLNDYSPPLDLRALIAGTLVQEMELLGEEGIFHGDLHTCNILIGSDYAQIVERYLLPKIYSRPPDIRIIDFGTSHFTTTRHSIRRHWRVFNETFRMLLAPLDINRLWRASEPTSLDCEEICAWYRSFLVEIEPMLISVGADWLIPRETDDVDDAAGAGRGTPKVIPYKNKAIAAELADLVRRGMLTVDKSTLGYWGTGTGRCGSG
jgi:serine/threonine protein kinase